ncbi:sigma 54 modulation/S30EA ribosomal C-terminal domain-containing protein [Nocardia sp. NPDC003979]
MKAGTRRVAATEQPSADLDSGLTVTTHGPVDLTTTARAARQIGNVLRGHGISDGRVRVTAASDAGAQQLIQLNCHRHHEPIRIQIAGPREFAAAIAAERLDRLLTRLDSANATMRCWPDPSRPALAVVTGPRRIVRRKRCTLATVDVQTAVRVMDAMDYDVELFTDAETGEDAIVYWAGPLGVRLARQHRMQPPTAPHAIAVSVSSRPALQLTDLEAADRLCSYGLPHLFFSAADDRRGRLLYRRHDGDLTIVEPMSSPGTPQPGPRPTSRPAAQTGMDS